MTQEPDSGFSKLILTDSLSPEALLAGFIHVFRELGWQLIEIRQDLIAAKAPFSVSRHDETLAVRLAYGSVELISRSESPGFYDDQGNRKNLELVAEKFNSCRPLLSPAFINEQLAPFRKTPEDVKPEKSGILAGLLPREGFAVTPVVLGLNVLVFILMIASGVSIFSPETEELWKWGANYRGKTLDGEWWRLITSCFLHIGIFHLIMNMYALYSIGISLEHLTGSRKFGLAYLLSGIGGSAASLWWNSLSTSAGASGAVFGMFGLFFALLTTDLIRKEYRQGILKQLALLIGLNLVFGLQANIDNAAHIGGLLTGALCGYLFYPSLKWTNKKAYSFLPLICPALLLGICLWLFSTLPNTPLLWDNKVQTLMKLETHALEVLRNTGQDNAKLAASIRKEAIPAWEEAGKIAGELENLEVPAEAKEQMREWKWYFKKQEELFELKAKALESNSSEYNLEILRLEKEIAERMKTGDEKK